MTKLRKKYKFTKERRNYGLNVSDYYHRFTGYLWWATRRLVQGAEKTASQQLRAYVHVYVDEGRQLFFDEGNCLCAPLIVKNLGQTPAYKLRVAASIALCKLPLTKSLEHVKYHDGSIMCIGPRQTTRLNPTMPSKLTPAEEIAIEKQEMGIYVWGYVEYIDIFKEDFRRTQFKMLSTGSDFNDRILAYCPDGNEAT